MNSSCQDVELPLLNITSIDSANFDHQQWYVAMLFVSCILISVPNAIIIICILKMRVLRKQVANHFILSFAFSDFVTGILIFPLGIIHEIEYVQRYRYESALRSMVKSLSINVTTIVVHPPIEEQEDLGPGFCDFLQTSINFICYVSLWHMTLISVDRYYRITSPVTYKRFMTHSRCWIVCSLVWILAAIVSYILYWDYKRTGIEHEDNQCLIYVISGFGVWVVAVLIALGPMLLMVYYYVKLIRLSSYPFQCDIPTEMYRQADNPNIQWIPLSVRPISCLFGRTNSTSSDSEENEECTEGDPRSSRSESEIIEIKARKKRCRRSKRAAVLIGFITVGNITFVLPTIFLYVTYTFFPQVRIQEHWVFYLYPWMILYNSAYNPWIYFFVTKELRQSTGLWFRKKFASCIFFTAETDATVNCPEVQH